MFLKSKLSFNNKSTFPFSKPLLFSGVRSFHVSQVLDAVPKDRKTSSRARQRSFNLNMKPIGNILDCTHCSQPIILGHVCG